MCHFGIGVLDGEACAVTYDDIETEEDEEETYDPILENRVQELEVRVSLIERRQQILSKHKNKETAHV